jgi:hypothetical protein
MPLWREAFPGGGCGLPHRCCGAGLPLPSCVLYGSVHAIEMMHSDHQYSREALYLHVMAAAAAVWLTDQAVSTAVRAAERYRYVSPALIAAAAWLTRRARLGPSGSDADTASAAHGRHNARPRWPVRVFHLPGTALPARANDHIVRTLHGERSAHMMSIPVNDRKVPLAIACRTTANPSPQPQGLEAIVRELKPGA